jgi:antirestriction protein ArdC
MDRQPREDIYARITQQIVAAIEAGPGRWKLPWHHDGSDVARPMNLVSRKRYRGINILALWVAAMKSGYGSGVWGTYRQFAEAGGQVRKGERATTVVFWKQFRRGDAEDAEVAEDGAENDGRRARFMVRGYSVFNLAQVEGLDLPKAPELAESERVASAEALFGQLGIPIRTHGDQACYVPSLDEVRMPPFARFLSVESFYATLAHETAHATAHASRLDRKLDTRFGSKAYAAEEAIAELTASYLMADLGFGYRGAADDGLQRSAAYIASWLEVLKADSRAIFTAAAKAQAAADWMHARQPGAITDTSAGEEDKPPVSPHDDPARCAAAAA